MQHNKLSAFAQAASNLVLKVQQMLEELEIHPRRNSSLDLVLAALLNRTINTHRSLCSLCDYRQGADAYVLARVIVEIWIVVRWITNTESEERARKFGLFEGKLIQHASETLKKHSPTLQIPQHPEHDFIAEAAAKYRNHVYWAGTVRELAEEQDQHEIAPTGSPLTLSWYYDVPYFISSWYVHSNVMGVRSLLPEPSRPFQFNDGNDPGLCEQALVLSTSSLVMTVVRIDKVWGLGIGERLEQLWQSDFSPLLAP